MQENSKLNTVFNELKSKLNKHNLFDPESREAIKDIQNLINPISRSRLLSAYQVINEFFTIDEYDLILEEGGITEKYRIKHGDYMFQMSILLYNHKLDNNKVINLCDTALDHRKLIAHIASMMKSHDSDLIINVFNRIFNLFSAGLIYTIDYDEVEADVVYNDLKECARLTLTYIVK